MKSFRLDAEQTAVDAAQLAAFGIEYRPIDTSDVAALEALRKERGYVNHDFVVLKPEMEGLEEKLKMFFTEHLHEDEEIRYVLDGEGIFDVRDKSDEWIRIVVQKNDLIIVPAGLYHRFTLTESRYIHAMRLFTAVPKWTPIYREQASAAATA